MKTRWKNFWLARSHSERVFLALWAIVIGVVATYGAFVSPLLGRISRLEKNVPVLEEQLSAMRSPIRRDSEVRLISNKPSGDLRSTVFQFLASQKLAADVRSLTSDRVEIRLPDMPMETALPLLEKLRQETSSRVVALSFNFREDRGQVQAVSEMEREL